MKLFIGSSANDFLPEKYLQDCTNYLDELFKLNYDLVFGATNRGIMALSYNAAKKYNKKVIGICPEIYKDNYKTLDCNESLLTKTVNERTKGVIDCSDAIIFLPGGIGTIYELFTAIETKRSKEFNKPIVIYNSCGYYNNLLTFLNQAIKENFISEEVITLFHISDSVTDTINYINNYYTNKNISQN